jgi:isopentenyl diphosphate isomerase/L-lactate dehydrogenase-like FMN-dependent dehydrogenase
MKISKSLTPTKIIADGGFYSDILKALALGASYVRWYMF